MKKTTYFLFATLFLSSFTFDSAAQYKNSPVVGLYSPTVSIKNIVNFPDLLLGVRKANYLAPIETPLSQAAQGNDFVKVKALLEAGANPNEITDADIRITALHTAIRWGTPEMIELFIKHKADVNFRTKNGMNSLHIAALWNSDGKIATLLLAAGADPNVLDGDSKTPREVALRKGNLAVADVLLKVMKPIAGKEGLELFEAVKTKNKERALELIKKGTNLNYEAEGDTTLTAAIAGRDTEMAKILLEAGADPNFKESKYGTTALRMAVQMSNVELVDLLVNRYKADANPKNANSWSLLHTAADFNFGNEITALLLAAGADPNVVDEEEGRAPYEQALLRKKSEIAKLLAMVTNAEKVAALKKQWAAKPRTAKTTVQTTVANNEGENKEYFAKRKMEEIARDIASAYQGKGFKLFGEGFTDAVGRNSNEPGVTSTAVYKRTSHTFVMISKNAVALNAKMNGTLLQIPCENCRTSISNYATSSGSQSVDGYQVITLNLVLINYQSNFVDLIFKSNSPGEQVKWLYLSKDL